MRGQSCDKAAPGQSQGLGPTWQRCRQLPRALSKETGLLLMGTAWGFHGLA